MTKQPREPGSHLQPSGSNVDHSSTVVAAYIGSALRIARSAGGMLRRRADPVVAAARSGFGWTSRTVQAMPIGRTRSLAAGSVGLAAGLYLGGAPRLITAAGVAPAALIGAAILMRPAADIEPEAAR